MEDRIYASQTLPIIDGSWGKTPVSFDDDETNASNSAASYFFQQPGSVGTPFDEHDGKEPMAYHSIGRSIDPPLYKDELLLQDLVLEENTDSSNFPIGEEKEEAPITLAEVAISHSYGNETKTDQPEDEADEADKAFPWKSSANRRLYSSLAAENGKAIGKSFKTDDDSASYLSSSSDSCGNTTYTGYTGLTGRSGYTGHTGDYSESTTSTSVWQSLKLPHIARGLIDTYREEMNRKNDHETNKDDETCGTPRKEEEAYSFIWEYCGSADAPVTEETSESKMDEAREHETRSFGKDMKEPSENKTKEEEAYSFIWEYCGSADAPGTEETSESKMDEAREHETRSFGKDMKEPSENKTKEDTVDDTVEDAYGDEGFLGFGKFSFPCIPIEEEIIFCANEDAAETSEMEGQDEGDPFHATKASTAARWKALFENFKSGQRVQSVKLGADSFAFEDQSITKSVLSGGELMRMEVLEQKEEDDKLKIEDNPMKRTPQEDQGEGFFPMISVVADTAPTGEAAAADLLDVIHQRSKLTVFEDEEADGNVENQTPQVILEESTPTSLPSSDPSSNLPKPATSYTDEGWASFDFDADDDQDRHDRIFVAEFFQAPGPIEETDTAEEKNICSEIEPAPARDTIQFRQVGDLGFEQDFGNTFEHQDQEDQLFVADFSQAPGTTEETNSIAPAEDSIQVGQATDQGFEPNFRTPLDYLSSICSGTVDDQTVLKDFSLLACGQSPTPSNLAVDKKELSKAGLPSLLDEAKQERQYSQDELKLLHRKPKPKGILGKARRKVSKRVMRLKRKYFSPKQVEI